MSRPNIVIRCHPHGRRVSARSRALYGSLHSALESCTLHVHTAAHGRCYCTRAARYLRTRRETKSAEQRSLAHYFSSAGGCSAAEPATRCETRERAADCAEDCAAHCTVILAAHSSGHAQNCSRFCDSMQPLQPAGTHRLPGPERI